MEISQYKEIYEAAKELYQAASRAERASQARFSLPHGTSRARVTTANARWMATTEHRELYERKLSDLVRSYLHA